MKNKENCIKMINYLSVYENKDVRNRHNELVEKCKELDRCFDVAINKVLNFKNELEQTENKCKNLVLEQNRLVGFYNELKENIKTVEDKRT